MGDGSIASSKIKPSRVIDTTCFFLREKVRGPYTFRLEFESGHICRLVGKFDFFPNSGSCCRATALFQHDALEQLAHFLVLDAASSCFDRQHSQIMHGPLPLYAK